MTDKATALRIKANTLWAEADNARVQADDIACEAADARADADAAENAAAAATSAAIAAEEAVNPSAPPSEVARAEALIWAALAEAAHGMPSYPGERTAFKVAYDARLEKVGNYLNRLADANDEWAATVAAAIAATDKDS